MGPETDVERCFSARWDPGSCLAELKVCSPGKLEIAIALCRILHQPRGQKENREARGVSLLLFLETRLLCVALVVLVLAL